MNYRAAYLGFLVAVAASRGADRQPSSATAALDKGESVYVLVPAPHTWAEADQLAHAAGGRLAVVTDAAVNARLFQIAKDEGIRTTAPDGGGGTYVWLGASDAAREGDWRWQDGRPVDGFTAWGRGPLGREPDDYGGEQDCLALGLTAWPMGVPAGQGIGQAGEWNDVSGENRLAWWAEFPADADSNHDGTPDWKTFAEKNGGIPTPLSFR